MAMFGLIVAGRLVSTNWEQISPTNLVSEIPAADTVNHLVVFLTGNVWPANRYCNPGDRLEYIAMS